MKFIINPGASMTHWVELLTRYAVKRAPKKVLTKTLKQLEREGEDFIFYQTVRQTGFNPRANDAETALTARVTPTYVATLLGSRVMGGTRA